MTQEEQIHLLKEKLIEALVATMPPMCHCEVCVEKPGHWDRAAAYRERCRTKAIDQLRAEMPGVGWE